MAAQANPIGSAFQWTQGAAPKVGKVRPPKVSSSALTGGSSNTGGSVTWPTSAQAQSSQPFQAPTQQLPSGVPALPAMGPYAGSQTQQVGPVPSGMGPNASHGAGLAGQAVQNALGQLGDPYIWGAGRGQNSNPNPNGFDCSGLTGWAYGRLGVNIGSTAEAQWQNVRHVDGGIQNARPGDLVFWNFGRLGAGQADHVGIYMGNNTIVHAPNPRVGVQTRTLSGSYLSKIIGFGRPT